MQIIQTYKNRQKNPPSQLKGVEDWQEGEACKQRFFQMHQVKKMQKLR